MTLPFCSGVLLLALVAPSAKAYGPINPFLPPTIRQEAALPIARLILHGTIANPTASDDGNGKTDFFVKTTLRAGGAIQVLRNVVLKAYLAVDDPKSPPHLLVFCDLSEGKLDPYRGVPLNGGARSVDYVRKVLALRPKWAAEGLAFYIRHLDDPDPEVAHDAFLEFAKASDADILKAAPAYDRKKLRAWLEDPRTPPARLDRYGLMLGACGAKADAPVLRGLLDRKARHDAPIDGVAVGYIHLDPKAGWALVHSTLADGRTDIFKRLLLLRAVRAWHLAWPKEHRPQVLEAIRATIEQGELADVAVESLRAWKLWDLTATVLKNYGKADHDHPVVRRAFLRYALCCPQTAATKKFLAERRKQEAETVEEVEEYLKLEKAR